MIINKKCYKRIIFIGVLVLLNSCYCNKVVYCAPTKNVWPSYMADRYQLYANRTGYNKILIQNELYRLNVVRWSLKNIAIQKRKELSQEDVYTFLQGPRSWSEGVAWSGEWCKVSVAGNTFGGFGCGLCCMANIYSTLTDYVCSPLDMYGFAKQVSSYYPTGKSGAISWEDIDKTLKKAGFTCELRQKPTSYEEFCQQIQQMKSAIVLVSSYNDDTFWKDTGGHYVNIWMYNKDSGEVFLAEPGSPENNRSQIPLKYIYDALKTSSNYQYLSVIAYKEEENIWKWNAINDVWNKPAYLK